MDGFNEAFPTVSPQRRGDGAQDTPVLLRLVRSQAPLYYTTLLYEVALWRAAGRFGVSLTSHTNFWSRTWCDNAVFATEAAARTHVEAILKNPQAACRVNSPANFSYYWDNLSYHRDAAKPHITSDYVRPTDIENGTLVERVAQSGLLDSSPAAGEVVRQLWARSEAGARAVVVGFARTAPLTYGNWTHWKWLYKQAEAARDIELLAICMVRLEAAYCEPTLLVPPSGWLEGRPSKATLAYLLRRARRTLHALAGSDPQGYVTIAVALLSASRLANALDAHHQWLSFDVLYSNSNRYVQSGHGRGGYVAIQRRPTLRTADERAADAWTARADVLRELATDPKTAWHIQEWAVKMLLRRAMGLEVLPDTVLTRYLSSPSSLLVRAATAYAAARLAEGTFSLAAPTAALLFYKGNGSFRRTLTARLQATPPDPKWDATFATALSQVVGDYPPGKLFSPRVLDSAALLGSHYGDIINADSLVAIVPALIATGRSAMLSLVRQVVQRLSPSNLPRLLMSCESLSLAQREVLVEMLVDSVRDGGQVLDYRTATALVFADVAWIRTAGWRMLAAFAEAGRGALDLTAVWRQLLSPVARYDILASGVTAPDALRLLPAQPELLDMLKDRLRADPMLLTDSTPDSFAVLLKRLGLSDILGIMAALPHATWAIVRARTLAELTADGKLAELWRGVWAAPPGVPLDHFIADLDTARTFATIATPDFLETSNPAFEPLLLGWLTANAETFEQGARPLLTAAMSKLPGVRGWALARLDVVGLTLPFALRLLESGLPESIAAGRTFFDAIAPGDSRELDYAVTLCDSPDPTVQRYGRQYIAGRRAGLPVAEMTRRLAEHPDPLIQEVVAQTLLDASSTITIAEAKNFDAQVLRTRDRGRRVKELVKQRLHRTPAPQIDTTTLLEMARSTTPRDAEWALQELARFALAGEVVEGVQIDGVGGI